MFNRWIEDGLLDVLEDNGVGCIAFCPLAQGLLTDKYIAGIPADSRAAKETGYLKVDQVTRDKINKVVKLGEIAKAKEEAEKYAEEDRKMEPSLTKKLYVKMKW